VLIVGKSKLLNFINKDKYKKILLYRPKLASL